MTAPLLTAYTFAFILGDEDIAQIVVETPTHLGPTHALRCARESLRKIPRCRAAADAAEGVLQRVVSARQHRREQDDAIRAAKREHFDQPRSS